MSHQKMPSTNPAVAHAGAQSTQWVRSWGGVAAIVGSLVGCSVAPPQENPAPSAASKPANRTPSGPAANNTFGNATALPTSSAASAVILQTNSRWVPVPWSDLPGMNSDALHEAWPAWVQSCTRPSKPWATLCADVRQLAQASLPEQRQWMVQNLQPYRVESLTQQNNGLLTGYYEPVLNGSRQPRTGFNVPLYAAPDDLAKRRPWYTRQEMETHAPARAALRDKALVYLADPVDAMVLHIQGSGLVNVTEPDGRQRLIRLAFGGTNDQPYKSIGRWLLDQNLVRDASWPGIKEWMARNPSRVNELLWKNPRVVFFKEERLPVDAVPPGPKGAQGVPLTAERSIAVDRSSIPYGTPVWLKSNGPQTSLDRLVLAQDTGTAIVGAVRADYYAGSGEAAGELAGRLKQPLQLWALWPR